ncbi:MAG: hypothetical protein WBC70_12160 [Candidatus Aminicenantales bacterium]
MKCESGFSASAFILLAFAFFLPSQNPASGQKEFGLAENEWLSKWERAQDLYIKAKDYFAEKDYKRAETELDSCLEFFPEHSGALSG